MDNKRSNISATLHPIGLIFFQARAGWAGAGAKKTSDLSSYLSRLTRYWFENWILNLKLKNKLNNKLKFVKKNSLTMTVGQPFELNYANFWQWQIIHSSKIVWSTHIWPVSRQAFNQNGLPPRALNTWDVNFFIKYTFFKFLFFTRYCWKIQN